MFKSGWEVLRENLPWLVDEMAIAPEAIHKQVMQVPGVMNCHDIASRGLLGRQVFIDMHLVVEPTDVEKAHEITEEIEARLEQLYGPARITIPHRALWLQVVGRLRYYQGTAEGRRQKAEWQKQ